MPRRTTEKDQTVHATINTTRDTHSELPASLVPLARAASDVYRTIEEVRAIYVAFEQRALYPALLAPPPPLASGTLTRRPMVDSNLWLPWAADSMRWIAPDDHGRLVDTDDIAAMLGYQPQTVSAALSARRALERDRAAKVEAGQPIPDELRDALASAIPAPTQWTRTPPRAGFLSPMPIWRYEPIVAWGLIKLRLVLDEDGTPVLRKARKRYT